MKIIYILPSLSISQQRRPLYSRKPFWIMMLSSCDRAGREWAIKHENPPQLCLYYPLPFQMTQINHVCDIQRSQSSILCLHVWYNISFHVQIPFSCFAYNQKNITFFWNKYIYRHVFLLTPGLFGLISKIWNFNCPSNNPMGNAWGHVHDKLTNMSFMW